MRAGLEIAGFRWPKAGHILEMAGKNKFVLKLSVPVWVVPM
jgi:hypothetical protein